MRALGSIISATLACCFCALAGGCKREDPIKAYQAPREVKNHHDRLEWTTPGEWVEWPGDEQPDAMGIRTYVGFTLDDQRPPLELIITVLDRTSPSAADVGANVNRWERQVGRPLSSPEEVEKLVTKVQLGSRTANVVDLLGPTGPNQKRTLAAMIIDADRVWYLKTMGPPDRLEAHKSEFNQFIASIKINGPKEVGPLREYKGSLSWVAPPTWEKGDERQLRELTYYAGDLSNPAEVMVTKLGGTTFGELLTNINRWRAQVGLPPVAKVEDQPSTRIELAKNPAAFFDFAGPGNAQSPNRRMLLVMGVVNNDVWFFKMIGPQQTVGAEKKNFDEFVKSVEFGTQK